MDVKESISQYWDWRSQSYTNGSHGFEEEEKAVWKRELEPFLPGNRHKRVLDVGTGPGFMALILAEMGFDVTGVDISKGMIEKARENARAMGLQVDFRHADGEQLAFDDGSFDLLVNRHLLWTLPHPLDAVREWSRVLSGGGRILAIDGAWFDPSLNAQIRRGISRAVSKISLKSGPSIQSRFKEHYHSIKGDLPLYSHSQPERICNIFHEAGLSNISFRQLIEVQKLQDEKGSLLRRLEYHEPTFLVTGDVAKRGERMQ
ncbi:class I SAM-dependent methyltransferase [Methanothrix sp.]|uniref:class I SAM-dependent methyltransferase n=1 Tax=Methanothrix sp. TaxID=90426 RepID=UPI003C7096C0